MIRLKTSRPKRSVPSGWSQSPRSIQTGGINFRVMSPSVGLCGARYGARTAVRTRATRIAAGNQGSCLRPGMANPRVEVAVEQIDEQIPHEIERAQHQHAGLYDGVVARGDALENEPSQARPREYGLGNHRAAQELHEQHDGKGDDG